MEMLPMCEFPFLASLLSSSPPKKSSVRGARETGKQNMSMLRRRQLFVDRDVQGALIARVVFYWALCLVAGIQVTVCQIIVTHPPQSLFELVSRLSSQYGLVLVVSLLLLPLVLADFVRVTNRVAGPMVRLRRAMKDLARGESTQPIRIRENDFWSDFVDDFNKLSIRTQTAGRAEGEFDDDVITKDEATLRT